MMRPGPVTVVEFDRTKCLRGGVRLAESAPNTWHWWISGGPDPKPGDVVEAFDKGDASYLCARWPIDGTRSR